jgi:DNA polymerase-4
MAIWKNHRKILHIDMDAFYASVEQRDNPSLKGKPVIVGGSPKSRSVVSAASYEARKFGVHSSMPIGEAKRRCPKAVFLPVNMAKYERVSQEIREIFLTYTPIVEPLSLDEAFLDVTGSTTLFGPAPKIAHLIKDRIFKELHLTASVGLATNKFLAKIASDLQKPDGFVIVPPDKIQAFLDPLPVERIWGVGKVTAVQLSNLGIRTIKDLRSLEEKTLTKIFGALGKQLFYLARGIDQRPVETSKPVKSLGREKTFYTDMGDLEAIKTELLKLALDVGYRLRSQKYLAQTITLKTRTNNFITKSRSQTLKIATDSDDLIYREACYLLTEHPLKQPLRLIGITLSNLVKKEEAIQQLSLFSTEQEGREELIRIIDTLNEKYGSNSITRARLL